MPTRSPRNVFRSLALIASLLALTGCVKARIVVDVHPNGAGTLAVALGMSQQALMLASASGEDPLSLAGQQLQGGSPDVAGVESRRWTEGDYEWVEYSRPFDSPEDFNSLMRDSSLSNGLSLSRETGLLRNRYILQGEFDSSSDASTSDSDTLLFNPSAMFEVQLLATLPGRITETNGTLVQGQPNTVAWTLQLDRTTSIRVVSETWNWLTIGTAAGGLAILAALVTTGALVARKRSSQDGTPRQPGASLHTSWPPTSPAQVPTPLAPSFDDQAAELYQLLGHTIVGKVPRGPNVTDLLISASSGQRWIARCHSKAELTRADLEEFLQLIAVEKPTEAAIITSGRCSPAARASAQGKYIHILEGSEFQAYLTRARLHSQKLARTRR